MISYPKIENLFTRDETTHKLNMGDFRLPQFEQIASWLITEKINGMNIRLVLDGNHEVFIRGRTDAAMLPKKFTCEALSHFPLVEDFRVTMIKALESISQPDDGKRAMIVFGEGYGPGIQKGGGLYAPTKRLRIFDVVTFRPQLRESLGPTTPSWDYGRGLWRTWEDVRMVADVLGLDTVPVVEEKGTIPQIIEYVYRAPRSDTSVLDGAGELASEGVVARTDPYLYDFRGDRVMFKLKRKDLLALAN